MPDKTIAPEPAGEIQPSAGSTPDTHPNADHTPGTTEDGKPKKRRRRRRKKSVSDGSRPEASSPETGDRAPEPGSGRAQAPPHGFRAGADTTETKHLFADISFADLGLRNSVLKGVEDQGFRSPTVIQSELIPVVLEGRDALGQARTGSGKTAAFGLPLFHLAQRNTPFQSLVLVPTRELAIQIARELSTFGAHTPIHATAIYGGDAIKKQQDELAREPEIIVATPGRLMDFLERGDLHLNNIRFAVLDEVDRMLDIGFREDIRKILGRVKTKHQTIFVSATISAEIEKLAARFMDNPVRITSLSGALTVEMVDQHYLPVQRWDKKRLLLHLLKQEDPDLTLVFCATKRMVDNLTKYLQDKGIDARAIHGDLPQRKRNSVMKSFRSGTLGVLVASDVAARGIDVEGISHVVNYDIPEDPEIYVHRIGRTARAGQRGVAWTFVSEEEGERLTAIEKLANVEIPVLAYPDFRPGPVPSGVRSRRVEMEKLASAPAPKPGGRELVAAPPPVTARNDDYRFPGGIVPARMPPKMIHGRVRTSRTTSSAVPPVVEEKPKP